MDRSLPLINLLLGVIIIALLAAITADQLAGRLVHPAAMLPGKKGATPVSSPVSQGNDLAAYAVILSSGLFGKATQGQLTPIAPRQAGVIAAPVTAPADLLLLGTVVGSFRETFALVRHSGKQEERVFRLGDMVFDAGRLAEVKREQAFIVVQGKRVELLTPMTPPAAAPERRPTDGAAGGGTSVANLGSGNYVIDQRALSAALDNIGQAMTDARLLPSQKEGKVEGFRVSEVKPSGVFAMIGIKNGDVLLRLNDFPIDSPDKALQSFMSLKGQKRLKLDLIREGQPSTFNYDIR